METLNNIILTGIFLCSIANLAIELDEDKDVMYVILAKCLFLTMAIGAILSMVRSYQIGLTILNTSILLGLVIRIIRGIKRIKKKEQEYDKDINIR